MAKSETLTRDLVERVDSQKKVRKTKRQLKSSVLKKATENVSITTIDTDGLNTLLESASYVVVIIQNNRIMYINKKGWEKFGYSAEQTIAKKVEFLIKKRLVKSSHQGTLNAYSQGLSGESLTCPDVTVIAESGESVPVTVRASMIKYNYKPALLIVMQDLREQSLKQSSQELTALFGAIDQMSGELRNILQSIANVQYYVKKELAGQESYIKNSQKIKSMLKMVDGAVVRADKILRDLSDMQDNKKQ